MARRLPLAIVALALIASTASADPTPAALTFTNPELSLTLPAGFQRLPARSPTPDLLGTFQRESPRGDGPMLLQLVHLGALVPQRPLTGRELAELRGSDPYPFTDTREHARALGFEVDSLAGRATVNGRALVRLSTAIPLDADSVRVVVMAPASREREAREAFREVLASARGPTSWQTPRERAQRVIAAVAIASMLLYGLLWVAVLRRRDVARGWRSAASFVIGALWLAVAVLAPSGAVGAMVRSLLLAAVFIHHGWRVRHR